LAPFRSKNYELSGDGIQRAGFDIWLVWRVGFSVDRGYHPRVLMDVSRLYLQYHGLIGVAMPIFLFLALLVV